MHLIKYIHVKRACFGSWIKERVILMCSVLVSVHGLKKRVIFMCSALVLVHGLPNEVYSCVARLFRFMN